MICLTEKSHCCGCNACVQRCPKQCIHMVEDEEGFLYPKVDTALCIDCGLCEKVCPVINQEAPKRPLHVYAAKNRHEEKRLRSSSGGIFILIAEHIIKQGGVVFGARFDKNWEVEHCYVEKLEELELLMRSKYVQSRIGNTYKEAEAFLKQGRQVLFVGTSCQIAGLKAFLRKSYGNLFTVDLICHGVPSPGIWRQYLKEVKDAALLPHCKADCMLVPERPIITAINFREKQPGGYSWKKYGFVLHGLLPNDKVDRPLLSTPFAHNPYMKGFLRNLYLRPSCHECPAKSGSCGSDLTIGDFWGIDKIKPSLDDDKGVGAILAYTQKGVDLLNSILQDKEEMSYADVLADNPAIIHSTLVPANRKRFWKHYEQTHNIGSSVNKALKATFTDKVKGKLSFYMRKVLS